MDRTYPVGTVGAIMGMLLHNHENRISGRKIQELLGDESLEVMLHHFGVEMLLMKPHKSMPTEQPPSTSGE